MRPHLLRFCDGMVMEPSCGFRPYPPAEGGELREREAGGEHECGVDRCQEPGDASRCLPRPLQHAARGEEIASANGASPTPLLRCLADVTGPRG